MRISWVTEQIAVGKAPLQDDFLYLKNLGINAIVDVRSEYCDDKELINKLGMKFLHLEIDDGYTPQKDDLDKLFKFALPLLEEGKKIFIHCQNGVGRAPLVCVVLLVKMGWQVQEAVNQVEEKHPFTSFNSRQEKFIYIELKNYIFKK